jgi:ABC-type sugar transport system, permease component
MTERASRLALRIFWTLLLGAFALTMVVPFVWMLSASFKLPADVLKLPIEWIPRRWNPKSYAAVWHLGNAGARDYHFALAYANSLTVALVNMAGALVTSSLAGYAFAKIRFRGCNIVFLFYLATMMIPPQVTLIPKFALFDAMGIMGSLFTLILPGVFTVTGTFLMRQFFMQVPDELREAARIDGASEFKTWLRVIMPVAKTSVASLAIMVFLWNWNDYLNPLVFLRSWRTYTIPLSLSNFIDESLTEYNLVMAASVSAILPVFIVFLAGQKYFIKGISAGAVKG